MKLSVKMVFQRPLFLAMPLMLAFAACPWDGVDNGAVDEFVQSWYKQAHSMQRELQLDLPLRQSTYIYTHNAYNAEAYQNWTIRYQFPNQIYSMYDQLRLGSRVLELDIHWYLSTNFKKDVLLCHGQSNHVGCVVWDRSLKEGLAEVRDFLNEPGNENEVVILLLEEYLDGTSGEDRAIGYIKEYLGDRVYKTANVGGPSATSALINKTNREILDAGANVILMGHTSAGGHERPEWGEWIFNKFVDSPPDSAGTSINDWRDKVSKGVNCDDYRSQYDSRFVRINNDGTNYIVYNGRDEAGVTEPDEFIGLMECNVNAVEADLIEVEHFEKAVWSWHQDRPAVDSDKNCAALKSTNRWADESCSNDYRFACKNNYGEFYITDASGAFNNGTSACYYETDGAYSFAVPVSAYENRKLYELRNAAGISDGIWLNYSDAEAEGDWVVKNINLEELLDSGPGIAVEMAYHLEADSLPLVHGSSVNSWIDSAGGLSFDSDGVDPVFLASSINGLPAVRFNGSKSLTSAEALAGVTTSTSFTVLQDGSSPRIAVNELAISNGSALTLDGALNGDVSEVIIYPLSLTAGDVDKVTCYLADKYSIAAAGCN